MTDLNEYLFPKDSLATTPVPDTSVEFDLKTDNSSVLGYHIKNLAVTNAKIGTAAILAANIATAAITTAKIADAAITNAKINDFTFNKGTGGTLTLGGTANGNGLMQVLNSSGGTVVNINNQGISVTGGSINVVNSAGSTIMDPTGLVSTSNFPYGFATASGTQETTSSSYVDVNGMSLSIVLTRTANVQCWTNIAGKNWGAKSGEIAILTLELNGTAIGSRMDCPGVYFNVGGPDEGVSAVHASSMVIVNMASGTNTLKTRFARAIGGTAAIGPDIRSLGYIVLGN